MSDLTNSSQGVPAYAGAPWAFRRAIAQGREVITPWWGMGDAIITLVGTAFIALATSILLVRAHIDPANGWGLIISTSLPWLGLAGWPIYATWRKGNGARIDLGLLGTPAHLRLGLASGVIAVVAGVVVAKLLTPIIGPISSNAGDLALKQSGPVLFVFCLLIMFGAPIVEEIAFRGMLFGALVKAELNGFVAVLITAGIFSLFHFEAKRLAILFVIGLVLGEVRRRTGSTVASIAAHFAVNTPAVIGILLSAIGIGN